MFTAKTVRNVAIVALALVPAVAFVQQKQSAKALTTQDYVEIEQLVNGYPYKIDYCTNSGYDYADMYTDDGQFGVASEWDSVEKTKIWYRGREELANAGGGGKGGCRPRREAPGAVRVHHINTSLTITPTATGAVGKSTLLATGAGGNPLGIEWQGGYQDVYVKTAKGWKFKSRLHVWPGYDWPDTPAEMAKRFAAPKPDAAK
jgi:hypothetical protein